MFEQELVKAILLFKVPYEACNDSVRQLRQILAIRNGLLGLKDNWMQELNPWLRGEANRWKGTNSFGRDFSKLEVPGLLCG